MYLIQGPKFYGGGAPSTPSNTTQTVNQNTIPEQLLPYTQTMLGAAENQIYTKDASGAVTGFQPYKPFSTNAADYVAPFTPLQQKAQQGAADLQTPSNFGTASGLAGSSGIGSLTAGQNYQNQQTNPTDVAAYMSPYIQNVMNQQIGAANRQYDISGTQQQGVATQAGAFGGSREALMAAENERNRNTAIGGIQATGLQNAFTNAQQQQYQGAQIGLQGMNQAGQAAGTLSNIGTQDLAAQTSVLGTQAAAGATQQAQQQQAIDQAVLDYKNAQQQPYTQIGMMSDLIRGTPINNSTSIQYQAQPSAISQIGGLAATGIGAYGALKANGGVIEDKGYANGGIVGYKLGGNVEGSMRGKLEDLDTSHLQSIIKENESPEMTSLAKEVLATKYAKGGIVAFASNNNGTDGGSSVKEKPDWETGNAAKTASEQKIIADKAAKRKPIPDTVSGGIADITPKEAATLGPMSNSMPLKHMAQNQAEGIAMPGIDKIGLPATPDSVDPMAGLQASSDLAEKEAAMPMEERIQQQKDLEEKFAGKDTGTAEYRKSIMDERANAPDEARRQMYMRLMEFGANWASTPGAPLVAGMKAITSVMPHVIEDTKDNKKMMRDLNQAQWQLDHAARLEELGHIDKATAQKEKSQETLMKYKDKIVDASLKKTQLDQEATIAENKDKTTRYVADTGAGADIQRANIMAGGTKVNKPMTENQRIGNNVKVATATNTELNKDINYTSESDPTKKREMYDRVYSKYHSQIFGQNTPTGDTPTGNASTVTLTPESQAYLN